MVCPPRGVVIAAGDDFGVKLFSAKEIEAAVRHGVALEPAPVLPLGRGMRRCPHPQPHRTEILRNPDRVIYRMEKNGDATYMGTLSYAGTVERNIRAKSIQAKDRK